MSSMSFSIYLSKINIYYYYLHWFFYFIFNLIQSTRTPKSVERL